jgi:glyoxalase family protein
LHPYYILLAKDTKPLEGIHHVTAITGDGQRNADFYSGVLGLRLVKKTVNFDDPGSYHLYYGDRTGAPGTLLTFFEWPGATPGKAGAGEPVAIALAVPEGSLTWWTKRFAEFGTAANLSGSKLLLLDPEGLRLELVETPGELASAPWSEGAIDRQYAIKGIHSTTLALGHPSRSHDLYTNHLTFSEAAPKHYQVGASWIEIETPEALARGRMGAGSIHHIAFRTEDDASQIDWLKKIAELGLDVSPVMDRKYFHSIYFRERNGVLFEIATDGPGMAVDESPEHLGESLALPNQYVQMRDVLERSLSPITTGRTPTRA